MNVYHLVDHLPEQLLVSLYPLQLELLLGSPRAVLLAEPLEEEQVLLGHGLLLSLHLLESPVLILDLLHEDDDLVKVSASLKLGVLSGKVDPGLKELGLLVFHESLGLALALDLPLLVVRLHHLPVKVDVVPLHELFELFLDYGLR